MRKQLLAILLCLGLLGTTLPYPAMAAEVTIILDGNTASYQAQGVTIQDNVLSITQAGNYVLTGKWTGQIHIEVAKTDELTLTLRDVSIVNLDDAALLISQSGDVTLVLEGSSQLISGEAVAINAETTYSEGASGAALQAKCDLIVTGDGSLFVGGYIHQGIRTSKDLQLLSGILTIEAVGSGIRCKDKLRIEGGDVTILSGGDGIHAATEATDEEEADGNAVIAGGTLTVNAYGDAIQSETTLTLSGGTLNLTTGGGSALAQNTYSTSQKGFGFFWDMDTANDENITSTKGLKSDGTLEITGGEMVLDCYDDAIHATGSITIRGGTMTLSTGDDGIHSDERILLSGGTIRVLTSYEGIEANQITVTDGDISVVASDDGFNANGGTASVFGSKGGSMGGMGNMSGRMMSGGHKNALDPTVNTPDTHPTTDAMETPDPMQMPDMNRMPNGSQMDAMPDGFVPNNNATEFDPNNIPDGFDPNRNTNGADSNFSSGKFDPSNMEVSASNTDDTLPNLLIYGGNIYVNAQGDGLDSNGNLIIYGGTVVVDGPNNSGNGALDSGTESGGVLQVHGGTVLAIGASGMAECFDSSSEQALVSVIISWQAGDLLTVTNSEGKVLFQHTAAKAGQSIIFSSPDLADGDVLTIQAGDTTTTGTAGFTTTSGGWGMHRR